MVTHLALKQLTLCQSTWNGIGFVPGLLTGVNTIEHVVSLVDTEDLSEELKKGFYAVRYFFNFFGC